MKRTQIEISEDEFDDKYPLVANHLNPNASWCVGDGPGCLFETYGEELDFVRQQDPCTVWTLVDGDGGDQYLTNGFHFVNRIGYLVSTVPVPDGMDIEVRIPMQVDPSPEPDKSAANMIDPDKCLSEIAREHLGIPTLGTRNSDSLDFYDVPVWGIRAALLHAYQAGVTASSQSRDQAAILREMREALERAEFLMRRVYAGDHHALENLPSAVKQARRVLVKAAKGAAQ